MAIPQKDTQSVTSCLGKMITEKTGRRNGITPFLLVALESSIVP